MAKNLKNKIASGQNLGFAVLIIIILTLIVVNFGSITGKTVVSEINVKVEAGRYGSGTDVVDPGGYIYVTIDPGRNRFYYKLRVMDEFERVTYGYITVKHCGEECGEKVPYSNREAKYWVSPSLEPGLYKVVLYDRTAEKHVVESFILK